MRDPEQHLEPLQRALYELMSEISEGCYFAGWLSGNEYTLWEMVAEPSADRRYGMDEVSERDIQQMREISADIGGWIEWRDDEQGLPVGEWGPYFISMSDWLEKFANDKAARDAIGKAVKDTNSTPSQPTPTEGKR